MKEILFSAPFAYMEINAHTLTHMHTRTCNAIKEEQQK